MKYLFPILLFAGLYGQQAKAQTVQSPQAATFQVGSQVYYEIAHCIPLSEAAFYSKEDGGRQLKTVQADAQGRVLVTVPEAEYFHPAFALNTLESKGSGRVDYFREKEFNLQALSVSAVPGGGATLSWQAEVPSAPLHFEVLRSVNGGTYEIIADVPSTASKVLVTYSYTDASGSPDATYKIRVQHAQKGARYTSEPLSAFANGIQVWPSATVGPLQVQASEAWLGARYTIANAQGQAVAKGVMSKQQAELSLADLPAGAYFISFENGKEKASFRLSKL